jgi:membrane carboxypeptidase/penicillin-binding protein PbpC
VEIELDVVTRERVGPGCRAGRQTHHQVRVIQPPPLRRWWSQQGAALAQLPPWAPGCSGPATAQPPRIVQPAPGTVVVLAPGLEPGDQELPLEADLDQPSGKLWWFVDGRLLAEVNADAQAWWTPAPGRHELVVQAANGTGDRRWVEVRAEL